MFVISKDNRKNASALRIYTTRDIWKFFQNCTSLSAKAIWKNFQISRVVLILNRWSFDTITYFWYDRENYERARVNLHRSGNKILMINLPALNLSQWNSFLSHIIKW